MCHHTFTLSYEMHFHLTCHYLNNDLCTPLWCRSIYPPTTTLINYSKRTSTFNEEKHHFKLLFIKSKSSRYYGTHNLSLILTITQIPIELCKIVCWLNLSNSHSSLNLIGRELKLMSFNFQIMDETLKCIIFIWFFLSYSKYLSLIPNDYLNSKIVRKNMPYKISPNRKGNWWGNKFSCLNP